jgi:hypothetical protein
VAYLGNLATAGVPAAINAALGGLNAADQAHYVASLNAIDASTQQIKQQVAAAARAAGGPITPGTYSGTYINEVGSTVIKPANFTAWANGESLLNNFDGTTLTTIPGSAGARNSLAILSGPAGMFASEAALRYALSYYPAGNNRINLPKLVTSDVRSADYENAIGNIVRSPLLPTSTVDLTNRLIGTLQLQVNAVILDRFSPNKGGVKSCVSSITGKIDMSSCPTLSSLDAANLGLWGRRAGETNKTAWTTPPNFLHWTDIKLTEGATYNDQPNNFGVSRTTTDGSAVLVVTCNWAPRSGFWNAKVNSHTSFIDYDDSNFILPPGYRISRRVYDGMIVYTNQDNHTQTYFPPGTFYKVSTGNSYRERPFLTACAATALAKLSDPIFAAFGEETKFRAAELYVCIKLAIKIKSDGVLVLGGGGGMQIPRLDRLYSKKSYKNNRKTKNKNRNKSKSMSMFKSAKRTFYRTNKRNKTSRHYH